VRSLARLLGHLETRLGDPAERAEARSGDLAGLARAFTREHRLHEALACLDAAIQRSGEVPLAPVAVMTRELAGGEDAWWSPHRPADFGGRPARWPLPGGAPRTAAFDAPWSTERITVDRAHLLRRLGRHRDAADAWTSLAAGSGRNAVIAAIELAKVYEHRLGNRSAAMAAVLLGFALLERRRRIGRPEPALETDLLRRHARLLRRGAAATRRSIA
jgi:hypothetical protein